MKFYVERPEGFVEIGEGETPVTSVYVHHLNPDRYVQFLSAEGSDIWYFDILPVNGKPTPMRICASAEAFE